MSDDTFDFKKSIAELEEINTWFQDEDVDLDEGLKKLRRGKDLIRQCRERLKHVENEFVKIKEEFTDEQTPDKHQDHVTSHQNPDEIPF